MSRAATIGNADELPAEVCSSPASAPGPQPWWFRPAIVSSILTVACLPVRSTIPRAGLDPSWELGLSLIHVHGIESGPQFVFTYGPLGFLAQPNLVWLAGAIFGLVYVVSVTWALYFLAFRHLLGWLPPLPATIVTTVIALLTVSVGGAVGAAPELAIAALALWALTLVRPARLQSALPFWVPLAFGAVAALQVLVKFSTGGAALAIAAIVALSGPRRLRSVAVLAGSFVTSLVALWLLAGQPITDLGTWLHRSLQLAAGYSAGQALRGGADGTQRWMLWVVGAGILFVGVLQFVQLDQAGAIPSACVLVLGAWFFTKEGFTRLDSYHVGIAYLGFALLIAAVPWQRRWFSIGVVGIVFMSGAIITASDMVFDRGLVEATRVVRSSFDSTYRSHELQSAATTIRAHDHVPDTVVHALRTARVHADPAEIAAVWASGLRWQPAPVFQTYQANRGALDRANADSLVSHDGPNAVLKQLHADSLERIPAWESPGYMVTLTCRYRLTAEQNGWQALERARDGCGRPRLISEGVLRPGHTTQVPRPRRRDSVVVARFDYPTSAIERVATALLKPVHFARVRTGGVTYSFVVGTASEPHLVHVPATIAGRRVTNAALDLRTLSFPDASGDVRVRFYELPTS